MLVDRMHINPVAFAFSVWLFSTPERRPQTTLEALINFGFEKSGFSCADKMRLYNSQCEDILTDVETAANYYNVLASEAATTANYFAGTTELLQDLQNAGVYNFITSAVEQNVLDTWSQSQQGLAIAPYLREILGKRQNFVKGRDHFEYVSKTLGCSQIYYVADASAEIETAMAYSQSYYITPIGFANVITVDRVLEAVKLVGQAVMVCGLDAIPFPSALEKAQVNHKHISLPTEDAITSALHRAGAKSVITGSKDEIMHNLGRYFKERALL